MPTYEYKCSQCGTILEVFHGMSANPEIQCPACKGEVERIIGAGAGIIVKGGSSAPAGTRSTRCGHDTPCCGRDVPCGESHCG
jgi:putative FmdB family regulatory protein